jgi:hypothetical protein
MAGRPARCTSKPLEVSRGKNLALGTLALFLIAGLIAVSGGLPSLEGRTVSAARESHRSACSRAARKVRYLPSS